MSLIVGVEVKMILRLLKVDARRSASAHGSPSPSTSDGNASTSSSSIQRQGADRKPVALLAPVSSKIPPGYSLLNIVFPLSRLLAGAIFSAKHGVSLINDSNRCLLRRLAISIVGCTNNAGPGACAIMYPTTLLIASVLPNCAPAMNTTFCVVLLADMQSMISLR
jgi:hypothetical protein